MSDSAPPTPPDPRLVINREVERQLEARLVGVRAEAARWRRIGTFVLFASAIVLGTAAAFVFLAARRGVPGLVGGVLEVRRLVVRDDAGHVRVTLGLEGQATGPASLTLHDQAGRPRTRLTVLPDGSPGLTFSDTGSRARLVLGLLPDQTVSLVFADPQGRTRTILGLFPDGSSTLLFANRAGATEAGIGIDASGRPSLSTEPPADAGN